MVQMMTSIKMLLLWTQKYDNIYFFLRGSQGRGWISGEGLAEGR